MENKILPSKNTIDNVVSSKIFNPEELKLCHQNLDNDIFMNKNVFLKYTCLTNRSEKLTKSDSNKPVELKETSQQLLKLPVQCYIRKHYLCSYSQKYFKQLSLKKIVQNYRKTFKSQNKILWQKSKMLI